MNIELAIAAAYKRYEDAKKYQLGVPLTAFPSGVEISTTFKPKNNDESQG